MNENEFNQMPEENVADPVVETTEKPAKKAGKPAQKPEKSAVRGEKPAAKGGKPAPKSPARPAKGKRR